MEEESKLTREEQDQKDLEEFLNHPLNIKEINEETLKNEGIQALQSLIYEGDPEQVAINFLVTTMVILAEKRK